MESQNRRQPLAWLDAIAYPVLVDSSLLMETPSEDALHELRPGGAPRSEGHPPGVTERVPGEATSHVNGTTRRAHAPGGFGPPPPRFEANPGSPKRLRNRLRMPLRAVRSRSEGGRGHPMGTHLESRTAGPESWMMGAGILPRMDLTTLPDEVKELVRAQIEAGRFQSVDEVVVEALRLLQEREELFASHRDQLRAQIAEGVAAEERGELRDGREAVADVRRRIDERLRSGE